MSDYMFLLESHLTGEQFRAVGQVQSVANKAGVSLYLTGGAMRDVFGGFPARDPATGLGQDAQRRGRSPPPLASEEIIAH